MARSGSVDFNRTRNDLIADAYRLCGIPNATTNSYVSNASATLNSMLKMWSIKGAKLWKIAEGTLSLVDGTTSYTLGPTGDYAITRPLEIMNPRRVVSSVETEIEVWTRSEYMRQSNKSSEGKAVAVYYDAQLDNGKLYVWPTPDSSSDSIKFDYRVHVDDMDASSNDFDFPPEWFECIKFNLAVRLAIENGVPNERYSKIKLEADILYNEMMFWDDEHLSVQMGVDMTGYCH